MRGRRRSASCWGAVLVTAVLSAQVFTGVAGAGTRSAAKPVRGDTFTYLSHLDLNKGFDPIPANGQSDSVFLRAVYDYLLYEDLKTATVKPGIALSLTSKDSLNWTLKLRPNVKFTDGTAYDAAAVMFNWQRMAVPANASPNAASAQQIASMSVVDTQTLAITLKVANSQFPRTVAGKLYYIASPTALGKLTPGLIWTTPVGAGPYVVKSYTAQSEAVFDRNPSFWDAPRPYFDHFTIKVIVDSQQRYNTFVSGTGDISYAGPAPAVYVNQARGAGVKMITALYPNGGAIIVLNNATAPFNDPVARKALYQALDLDGMNKTVNLGANIAPKMIFGKGSPFYAKNGAKLPAYDPTAAQKLLDQLAASGKPLNFAMTVPVTLPGLGEYLQARLASFKNITMTLSTIAVPVFLPIAQAGNYQAMMGFQASSVDPDIDFYDQFYSTSTRNYWKYSNPTVDAALAEARASLDPKVRYAAYQKVQTALSTDVPVIFYQNRAEYYFVNPKLKGWTASTALGSSPLVKFLWVAKAK